MPHTVNTVDEHLDMLMVCHHLNPRVPEDLAFAESRIRATTIAAEDVLHDLGAISMIGSDSQAMGRVGEVVLRTWQTAHVDEAPDGARSLVTGAADNLRARRYVAKYTICPAVAHGLDGEVGSVEPGKLADLVLWHPAFFGVRPHVVVKGGMIAWAQMGDANASIPTPQPVLPRPMFGAAPAVAHGHVSVAFVAPVGLESGLAERLGLGRRLVPVERRPRGGRKADLALQRRPAPIPVDPDTFAVRIDGEVVESQPGAGAADGPALLPLLMSAVKLPALALLLVDARLPNGGHAHSAGAEQAVEDGIVTDLAGLVTYVAGRVASSVVLEAHAAALCLRPRTRRQPWRPPARARGRARRPPGLAGRPGRLAPPGRPVPKGGGPRGRSSLLRRARPMPPARPAAAGRHRRRRCRRRARAIGGGIDRRLFECHGIDDRRAPPARPRSLRRD